jgi:ABC-type branched-subunit amino acid transport system substrate-binding protein
VLATQKMISRDHVFALVSTLGTPTSAATLPIATKNEVPQLFPFTGGDFSWDPLNKYSFQTFTPYRDQARAGVKYMVDKFGFRKVCSLYQDDEFGQTVSDGAQKQAEEMSGVDFVEQTTFKRGATDFSAQISRMKASECDLVVLGTIVSETIGAIGEAQKIGWDVQFMTTSAAFIPQLPPAGKKNAVDLTGLYSTGLTPIYYEDTAPADVKAWMERYKSKFDDPPGLQAMGAYDHVMLFRDIAEKVGRELTVDKFIAELEKLENYQPQFLAYSLTFSPESHLGSRNALMAVVKGDRWQTVEDKIAY